jgi:hypothetical protein
VHPTAVWRYLDAYSVWHSAATRRRKKGLAKLLGVNKSTGRLNNASSPAFKLKKACAYAAGGTSPNSTKKSKLLQM